MDKAKIV